MPWRKQPVIYEIATLPWLTELSARYGRSTTFANVPAPEWDALAELDLDAVWFMGVWERSPAGVAISNVNPALQEEFRRALPDYQLADNLGSAYCIRNYVADARLGGPEGLARARAELARRGIRLILDFVPNHIASDSPWVEHHSEYFVHGTESDLARAPEEFFETAAQVIANGRDPFFPPWRDVLQLNVFHPALRAAAIDTAKSIAAQCDGMRCDMAMLALNDIFARTWGERAGSVPATEYWSELIPAVRAQSPDVLFIAEAYWDLEATLLQLGFDYCYDKRLYDRLVHENASGVLAHLQAVHAYQGGLLRFIENHDEPRAASIFALPRERAAAVVTATLPGANLLYEGQLDGRKIRLPVFLRRRAAEPRDYALYSFYRALLNAVHAELFHQGVWSLCECQGWSDNNSALNLLAWSWHSDTERALIVVNLSDRRSQGMVHLPWTDLGDRMWRLEDRLNGDLFLRDGLQLQAAGLFVDLDAWRYHFFMLT